MDETRPRPDRATILRLAVEAELDPRTVQRALERGVEALRTEYDRKRLVEAAKKIGRPDLVGLPPA